MNPTQENDKLKSQKKDAQQNLKKKKKFTSDQKKKEQFRRELPSGEKTKGKKAFHTCDKFFSQSYILKFWVG